ncbi:tetraacyldisaccharide 4'-kinase [Spirosoma telluris]|uniref:tetraacyldisaccharide 4'-kinase n=1 Tax=Spirosoma telluris TaxID=2183553 RepID=UPI002FC3386C
MKRLIGKWLLLPLSGLYGLVLDVRNWLYDSYLLKSIRPSVYSIGVGNLTVGGTGKTPMIEFLIKRYAFLVTNRLAETATLSRGYGRLTRGFRNANDTDTAETIGDEPLQLYRKFGTHVRVCVGERRADAIQKIQEIHPETKRILLDDAFQHRAVRPHLNILLMDYNRPFYDDYPFPAGRLRERRKGANRADVVVVTKCQRIYGLLNKSVLSTGFASIPAPKRLFFLPV